MTETNAKPKTFIPYYGGKSGYQSKRIVSKFPNHKIYVEPFGGAAGVLLAKEPSYLEIYNDLNEGLVNLFRVVQNPENRKTLLEKLEFTLHARAEWRYCHKNWRTEKDPIEKARMFYVVMSQSFIGITKGGSWSCGGVSASENPAGTFFNSFEKIKLTGQRFRSVLLENQPALNLLKRWDSPETLFYLDPPYVFESRSSNSACYEHEMTDSQHIELLEWCLTAKSMILISGYPSQIYEKYLEQNGWIREDTEAWASSAMQSVNNGLKGAPREKFKRIECLWLNPACITALENQNKPKPVQPSLFDLEVAI